MTQCFQAIQDIANEIASQDKLDQVELDAYWTRLNTLQKHNQIGICALDFRGDESGDESIRIHNSGNMIWDISRWKIKAGSPNQVYVFPKGTLLYGNETLSIATQSPSTHSFNSLQPVWNNRGDIATLLDNKDHIVATWVYGKAAHVFVTISNLFYNGEEFRSEGDEYVELSNNSSHIIDLSHWSICAERSHHTFTFPPGAKLAPLGKVRVYTNRIPENANEFSFQSHVAIWNNQGGSCELKDYMNQNVDTYTYTYD